MRLKRLLVLLLAPLLIAATRGDDVKAAYTALRAEDARVATVAYRLAVSNRDICPVRSPWFGLVVHELRQYAPIYRVAVAGFFDLGAEPAIEVVVPDGAAEHGGAKVGDRLLAINGIPVDAVPPGKRDPADYRGVERVLARLADASRVGPVRLTVLRAGTRVEYGIAPEPGCRSQVQLETVKSRNAGADGTTISIGLDAAAAAHDDDELAVSIAHEMAHNILRHSARLDREGVSRGRAGKQGRDAAAIRKTEDEADLLGLYLMARAGFDIDVAPAYWERLSGAGDATHAGGTERRAMTQHIVDQIRARQAKGEKLTPPIAIPDL